MKSCFLDKNHRAYDYKNLCQEHSLCSPCFDNFTLEKLENLTHCNLCKSEIRIQKQKKNQSLCLNCKSIRPILSKCDDHKLCESCLKFPDERLSGLVENCPMCKNFLFQHCANCFRRFEPSDKKTESICNYKHNYCINCFISNDLKEKSNLCLECKDWLVAINKVETTDEPNRYDQGDSSKFSRYEQHQSEQKLNHESNQAPHSLPKLNNESRNPLNLPKSLKFCSLCNKNEEVLHCGHLKCLPKLLKVFEQKIRTFSQTLHLSNFSTLENDNFSISCYESQCNNLYCYPVYFFFNEGIQIFESIFKGYGALFMSHYEAFFEGSKYKFFICDSCKLFIGLTSFNPYCLYCKQAYQIEE